MSPSFNGGSVIQYFENIQYHQNTQQKNLWFLHGTVTHYTIWSNSNYMHDLPLSIITHSKSSLGKSVLQADHRFLLTPYTVGLGIFYKRIEWGGGKCWIFGRRIHLLRSLLQEMFTLLMNRSSYHIYWCWWRTLKVHFDQCPSCCMPEEGPDRTET